MSKRTYHIRLQPEPEGGFTVTVPALPGCVTWGESVDHALEMAQEAIALYIESLVAEGEPVPDDAGTPPSEALIQVEMPGAA